MGDRREEGGGGRRDEKMRGEQGGKQTKEEGTTIPYTSSHLPIVRSSFVCLPPCSPSSSHPSSLPRLPLFCLPPVLAPFFLPHSVLSPASTLLSHSSSPPPTPCSSLSLLPSLSSLSSFPFALLSLLLPTFFCPQHFIPPHVKSFFLFPHQHPTHSPKYPSHPRCCPYTPLQSPLRSTGRCTSAGGVASSRAAHPWGQL